jgi:hypothetical protein
MDKRKETRRAEKRRMRLLKHAKLYQDAIRDYRQVLLAAQTEWPGEDIGNATVYVTTHDSIGYATVNTLTPGFALRNMMLRQVGAFRLGYDSTYKLLVIRLPESCTGETKGA